jgi:AcrR family transcriptional regulator
MSLVDNPKRKVSRPAGRRSRGSPERIAEILDNATEVFNTSGASAQMVDLVAARSGLDRASLYYYFGSREELIFSTYRRSCEAVLSYLDDAIAQGGSALSQIERLVRKALGGSVPLASLSEIGSLSEPHHQVIDDLRATYLGRLTAVIQQGGEAGDMRSYRPDLAARALEGVLALAPLWTNIDRAESREAVADVVVDTLFHGRRPIGAPATQAYSIPRRPCIEPTFAGFDREAQGEQKREAMLTMATRLMNRKGVNGTTLDDVVRALNVTKGAFYHYFDSKDDLLFQCYTRSQVLTERYIAMVLREPATGLEMLQLCAYHNFSIQLSPVGPLTLFIGAGSLPGNLSRVIWDRAAMATAAMREIAYRGIEDGSLRPHDVSRAQTTLACATAWIPMWYEPHMGLSVEDIAATFIPFYSDGLKRRPTA